MVSRRYPSVPVQGMRISIYGHLCLVESEAEIAAPISPAG